MMDEREYKSASEIIYDRFIRGDAEAEAYFEEAYANLLVSHLIRKARTDSGLTQQELAERAGTTKSAISRLENANYKGHSLAMLSRIARALGLELRVEFVQPQETAKRKSVKTQSSTVHHAVSEEPAEYQKEKASRRKKS